MLTVEEFLALDCKGVVKHFADLGYTQLTNIFNHKDFAGKYSFKTKKEVYPAIEKRLAVLGIEDKAGAIMDLYGYNSTIRTHGAYITLTIDPSKLVLFSNVSSMVTIPELYLEYDLWDTARKITKVYIKADRHKDGVFDRSAYWISEDKVFDTRPEYTKFGLGLEFDCSNQTVVDHIADLYHAAETKGKIAQNFWDRTVNGDLKKEIESITGENIPFRNFGMHHMIYCGFFAGCVEEEGLDFSDLAALCAGEGIGVCGNTVIEAEKVLRSGDPNETLKETATRIKEFFNSRKGVKSKAQIIQEAYLDLADSIRGVRNMIASRYGLTASDLDNITIDGKTL